MGTKHFPKGLDGRQRDADGRIRKKRSDTKVATLRKEYSHRRDRQQIPCQLPGAAFCACHCSQRRSAAGVNSACGSLPPMTNIRMCSASGSS
jgi:hypothetical protein